MVFTIVLNGEGTDDSFNIREYYKELLPNTHANIFTNICNDIILSKIRYHK